MAEAKAILRTYIGRVEYDPGANKARVGFFKVPDVLGNPAPENSRICVIAGGGFRTNPSCLDWEEIDLNVPVTVTFRYKSP